MSALHRPSAGFTLVEIIITIAIIALISAIAIPNNMAKNRQIAQYNLCFKNLTAIEPVKQVWGIEKGKSAGDKPIITEFIGPNL